MRKLLGMTGAVAAASVLALSAPSSAEPAGFTPPLRLTEPNFGGFEPSIAVDRHNNVFVTAHKAPQNYLLGKDPHGPAPVRAASFLWHSADGGKTFGPLPGVTPVSENKLWPAIEGDFALDGADRLYFVDTYGADNSLTRWSTKGRGDVVADFSRPAQGTSGLDDRPWLAAHGDGVVMYLGNGILRGSETAGNYTVYMSYDGGESFNPTGVNLPGSTWCHGAADPRPKSTKLHVVCNSETEALYAYTSDDDGRTFTRTQIGQSLKGGLDTDLWPSVAVGLDGTVHALFNLLPPGGGESAEVGTRLVHFSSRDGGRTWRQDDITPRPGHHYYSWLDVARDGRIGVAYYYRSGLDKPWVLYAGTARPGAPLTVTALADVAPASSTAPQGDFFQVRFGPDRKLHVAYTSTMNSDSGVFPLDVYYTRQR